MAEKRNGNEGSGPRKDANQPRRQKSSLPTLSPEQQREIARQQRQDEWFKKHSNEPMPWHLQDNDWY